MKELETNEYNIKRKSMNNQQTYKIEKIKKKIEKINKPSEHSLTQTPFISSFSYKPNDKSNNY
jgi:hypothetical protein